MKKTQIFGIVALILIIVAGTIYYMNRGSSGNPADSNATTTADILPTIVGAKVNGPLINSPKSWSLSRIMASTTVTDIEQIAEVGYTCADSKHIIAYVYLGGKDPRADITLIDNAKNEDSTQGENRRIILKEREAKLGTRHSTDGESIVFTTNNYEAKIIENAKSLFKNCTQKLAE